MKRNKTKKWLILGICLIPFVALFALSMSMGTTWDLQDDPEITFYWTHEPCYEGPYEPLLAAGLQATKSCATVDYNDYDMHIEGEAAYADNGHAPIAITSGETSKWDSFMGWGGRHALDEAQSQVQISWPFKIVQKNGQDPDPAHSPIQLGIKYEVGLSAQGYYHLWGSFGVSPERYVPPHHAWINWGIRCDGSHYCEANRYNEPWEPVPFSGEYTFDFWHISSDSPYIWLHVGIDGYAQSCDQDNPANCDNEQFCYVPSYSNYIGYEQAYLYIDPEWEHANEYEILTLNDIDAPVNDPASWVEHIDTPIGSAPVGFSWGDNSYGQLGDGSATYKNFPVQVVDPIDPAGEFTNVVDIAGYLHSLALKSDGTVWAWGLNNYSQLGDGSTANKNFPVQVIDPSDTAGYLTNVMDIACGVFHSIALKSDGTVWAWGLNDYGQLGDGTQNNRTYPVQVLNLTDVVAVEAGAYHSLALKSDGTVWAWGRNDHGQLGNDTFNDSSTPVQVVDSSNPMIPFSDVVDIAAGIHTNLALKTDGSVWAWGYNHNGQLGDGSTTDRSSAVQVMDSSGPAIPFTGVEDVAARGAHHLALKTDGTVWAWGYNGQGQLGDGTQNRRMFPVQVLNLTDVMAIEGGESHSLALKSDGTVWTWGYNAQGQLGNGTYNDSSTPVQTIDPSDPTGFLTNVIRIAGGGTHSLAIKGIHMPGYTQANTNVTVQPVDSSTGDSPVILTFDNVTDPGMTFVSTSTGGTPPTQGFQLGDPPVYYYIMTTAEYTGLIEVCIDYSGINFDVPPVGLFHYENGQWEDVTTSHVDSVICGSVSSLSPFAIFAPNPIIVSGPECVNVGKGKGKKANKIAVSPNENYPFPVNVTIDQVEIFNNGGQAVKGKGVYEIDGNDIYIYPNGQGWSICITVTATDENGNTVKTERICKFLKKC